MNLCFLFLASLLLATCSVAQSRGGDPVDSSVERRKYGFDIDLLTEFHARDGATVSTIKGHGESNTGKWSGHTPEKGAKIALQYAVSAVLDGDEGNRRLFVH